MKSHRKTTGLIEKDPDDMTNKEWYASTFDCPCCDGTGEKLKDKWPAGTIQCWACRGRGWFLNS